MGINIVNYNGKALVDLSKDTVTPLSMLSGTTAHNAAGDIITGNLIVGEQVNADWNATEGAAAILNKPPLSAVATSGNYADLQNKPATMTGATAEAAGTSGFVPAPSAGDENKVLKGDGTWGEVDLGGIVTELNGKAGTDLSNINTAGKNVIANMAMPSEKQVNLTFQQGGKYTAPADGYFSIKGYGTVVTNIGLYVYDSEGKQSICCTSQSSSSSEDIRGVFVPVKSGQ